MYNKSRHLFGDAADIKISGLSIQEQEKICKKYFDGVGSYGTFTHVDKRGWEARW